MKRTILIALCISACTISFAGTCEKNISLKKSYTDSTLASIPAAPQLLAEIMEVTGLRSNFELKRSFFQFMFKKPARRQAISLCLVPAAQRA